MRSPFFCWGLDAPTPARTMGLPPRGGQYFLSKRKKVPKKARGTALREKGFYCPFCRRGSQRRAQFSWIANTNVRARSCAHLFPPSKWAGLFPFAAYRRSAPPQVAWSILKWRCLGCVYVAWMASQRRKTDLTFGASHTQIVPLGIIPHRNLDIFVTQKASVGSNPRWHF